MKRMIIFRIFPDHCGGRGGGGEVSSRLSSSVNLRSHMEATHHSSDSQSS